MGYRDLAISFVATLILVCVGSDVTHGKVVETRKFEKSAIESGGGQVIGGEFGEVKGFRGWRTRYDSRAGSPVGGASPKIVIPIVPGQFPVEKGTLVVWFYYDGMPGVEAERRWECVFSLLDQAGASVYGLYLVPKPFEGGAKSLAHVGGFPDNALTTYGHAVPFAASIPGRRWSYVAMTWGPEPARDNKIYLNGVPATGYFADYAMARPIVPSVNAGSVFAASKAIAFGGDGLGTDSFTHGMLGDVEIHDEILTSYNFPPRGLPVIRSFSDDSFTVPGISGKLVAGDKVAFTLESEPGGKASVDVGSVTGIALAEEKDVPGKYAGVFQVPPGLLLENVKPVARFTDDTGVEADNVAGQTAFTIDSLSRFALTIDKTDLPADSAATARVKVKVTDANGNPVESRRIKVTLSTTDEYTGLVGGGSTRSKDIAAANEANLGGAEVESRWNGITDSWGEVEFDFKSGFAAKTIILQAKDLTAGNVGVDYITSYKEASIDIALTAPRSLAAARRGLQYIMKVEATRTELTADGKSRSVIRATVLDPNGAPVAGDPVTFSLSSANGTIRTVSGTTDAAGVATAEYIAGRKMGIVVVTAMDTARNVSGSVSIILLADAPAKIHLRARPESLPADGFSRADLSVKVTDINDNPNKDTKVEFKVNKGGGRLDYADRTTDQFGDAANRYTSGTAPGIATILATVRSKVPTDAELAKAQNVLFVPYSDQGEEIRVSRWLKRVGETALKGEPIVEYTIGRDETKRTLNAPYDCRLDFQYVEYWDYAQTGDTLAQIVPVTIPGSTGSTPPVAPARSPRRR